MLYGTPTCVIRERTVHELRSNIRCRNHNIGIWRVTGTSFSVKVKAISKPMALLGRWLLQSELVPAMVKLRWGTTPLPHRIQLPQL